MTLEIFSSSWVVFYDWSECAYDVITGSEWLKRDREHWLHQHMPTRVMLDIAESEADAQQRLKDLARLRTLQAIHES
ncbi:MAG TPA: hypothetical protein VEH04_18510 [Verrucomicrobiae bacterium]|nr:hypothetical protein [Verrucomicrobiae bacterium]